MKKWYEIANEEIGTKEIKGAKDNPDIVQYFDDVGHDWVKDDETAWCAAFVGSCLEKSGITSTRALNARSYLKWGISIDHPVSGCIVVFKRGNSSWQGHVAFYVSETKTHIKVLGGNQSNQVKISSYRKSSLLGYRMPKTKTNSKTNIVSTVGVGGAIASQTDVIIDAIDKVSETTEKGGDLADKIGSIFNSVPLPVWGLLAVVGIFIFIIKERNKKVDSHGI